jgi:hypothetical protein
MRPLFAPIKSLSTPPLAALCLLLAIAKLILVSSNEIICLQDDSATYARQAVGPWTLGFPPGYPLWLKLCAFSGFPQRICIEILYLLAAFVGARAAQRMLGLLSGVLFFTFLAFAPFSFFLFDRGLSDGFYAVLSVLAFGLSMSILAGETIPHVLAAASSLGAVLGVMSFTRNEDPLLFFWLVLLLLASALAWNHNRTSLLKLWAWRKPAATVAVSGFCGVVAVVALCFSFYLADGVFARGLAVMPEHSKLLKNLASIDTGQSQLRYVSISRRARELAYSVSPTLAKLQAQVEDPADVWHTVSRQSGLPEGEIGTGWIWHTFNSKLMPAVNESKAAAEATYKQINAELERAFREGRLKKRLILHPLLGGDLPALLHFLPASLSAVGHEALDSMKQDEHDDGLETTLFDQAFLRRAALEEGPKVFIEGWAFVPVNGRKIVQMAIASDIEPSARIDQMERPDVYNVFVPQYGWRPSVIGFRSDLRSSSPDRITITYVLDDGSTVRTSHLAQLGISKLTNASSPQMDVLEGLDVLRPHDAAKLSVLQYKQARLVKIANSKNGHRVAIAIFAAASILLLVSIIQGRNLQRARLAAIVLAFAFSLWCARVLFYSVLDAGAWNAHQTRYLAATNAMGTIMLAQCVCVLLTYRYSRKSQ